VLDPELFDHPLPGTPNATSWNCSAQSRPTPSNLASFLLDGHGRWRRGVVLMDQSSRDDILEGVTPPPVPSRDAVSRQSSRDERKKRSLEVPDDQRR